jgi:DNA polymerase-3 subunit alpha
LNAISNKKSDQQGVVEKISQEMNHFGIRFLPPSLTKSELKFSIKGKDIRYGLSAIKGVSEKNFEKLLEFRKEYASKLEMFEAAQQAGLNIGILSALIYSGCLDEFNSVSRSRLVLEAQLYNILTNKEKLHALRLSEKYNHDIIAIVKNMHETERDEKDKPLIADKRRETIKKKFEPYFELFKHNKKHEELSKYIFERHYLGYIFSVQLKDIFESDGDPILSVSEVNEKPDETFCTFVGVISEIKKGIASNSKKTRWLRIVVSDESGSIGAMLFNDNIDALEEKEGRLPKKEDMVFIKGTKKGDSIFANKVSVQDRKVFLKTKDLAEKIDKSTK